MARVDILIMFVCPSGNGVSVMCLPQDCSPEALKLFQGQCLSGPFGGEVSPVPDYLCIAQSAENAPDWFPFLCVISLPENNPFLGLFYEGDTM